MFPVSLLPYFPKNSVLFHIYTSILKSPIPVCTISHFSEYMKAIQELLCLSTTKSTNCSHWYLFPCSSMQLQQRMHSSSHQRTILPRVIWIPSLLFLRTVLQFFFSLASRISLFLLNYSFWYTSTLKNCLPSFLFLAPLYFMYLSSNYFIFRLLLAKTLESGLYKVST